MTYQFRFDASRAIRLNSETEERYFRAGMWFRAALLRQPESDAFCAKAKGLSVVRAASEGINTAGGFLVPTEVEDLIIANRQVAGVARREVRQVGMKGDLLTTPTRASGLTATFAGEGATLSTSDAALGAVGLTAQKLYCLTKMSSELDEDASSFGQFITEEIGFAFASKEDDCLFIADATSTYAGMSGITKILIDGSHDAGKVTATSGNDTFVELTATDLGACVGALPEQYLPGAKWYCSAFALGNTFVRLGATAVGTVDSPTGPRPLFQYGGYPVVPTPKLPGTGDQSNAIMVVFGDLSRSSTLGSARGIAVRVSEHIYFTNDQHAVRGTERFDLVNHNLGDNTTAGAVVGLMGN